MIDLYENPMNLIYGDGYITILADQEDGVYIYTAGNYKLYINGQYYVLSLKANMVNNDEVIIDLTNMSVEERHAQNTYNYSLTQQEYFSSTILDSVLYSDTGYGSVFGVVKGRQEANNDEYITQIATNPITDVDYTYYDYCSLKIANTVGTLTLNFSMVLMGPQQNPSEYKTDILLYCVDANNNIYLLKEYNADGNTTAISYSDFTYKNGVPRSYIVCYVLQPNVYTSKEVLFNQNGISDPITMSSNYYYLCDPSGNGYAFNVMYSGGDSQENYAQNEYEVNKKFNVFTIGKNKYRSGSISGMLVYQNNLNTIENKRSLLSEFRSFINSDGVKILRTKRGDVLNVFVISYNESLVNINASTQSLISNIQYVEVGDVNGFGS